MKTTMRSECAGGLRADPNRDRIPIEDTPDSNLMNSRVARQRDALIRSYEEAA
jgi:hypothetical protein